MNESCPIIVAVYHGEGGPKLHTFLHEFLEEMENLHPNTTLRPGVDRCCTSRLRAIIADAKERFTLKGECNGGCREMIELVKVLTLFPMKIF